MLQLEDYPLLLADCVLLFLSNFCFGLTDLIIASPFTQLLQDHAFSVRQCCENSSSSILDWGRLQEA